MKTFLHEVAADLYGRYGEGLSEREVLFPSRRARLFFVDALSQLAGRPLWQPLWTSIDELMTEISGLRAGDRVRLVTELYHIYSQYHREPFDRFYFWGEMLLGDFDMIDKYRIDASMLFRNISDIKELEADISYLTPSQLQILRFWSSLGPEAELSEEKRRFLAIWRTLGPIYEQYRERLSTLGFAYGGMIQRAAADRLRAGTFAFERSRRFVVAGFNALSECEKELFRFLGTHAEADFYWDYDTYYSAHAEQEAGMFVRENIVAFPSRGAVSHDNMASPKEFTAVAAASNAVQCKYVHTILETLKRELPADQPFDKRTAVVLTDENLLLPLLYALPSDIGKINVTMGYPLRASLAYTFVERLLELQAHRRRQRDSWTFYHSDVTGLLSHPYVADDDVSLVREMQEEIVRERRIAIEASSLGRTPLLKSLFTAAVSWQELSDWLLRVIEQAVRVAYVGEDARQRVEFLSVVAGEIVKLRNSLDGCGIELTPEVYASLLRRHLQTQRIPYEGEPLEGIQVMGILETRNLDFENVILLSMNDDNFPGNHMAQASFIPYNLRAAYGLPTPEHHEGVYAYYFYRLVQRARRVWMVYCSHADDKSTGEASRYITQLDYESGHPVKRVEVGVDANLADTPPIEVAKDEEVMRRLLRFTDDDPASKATLSPTAFFRYVACPLRFYFHSVARIEADEEISEEIDAPMFGTILHAAAQQLYTRVLNEAHPGETLRALLRTDAVAEAVDASIRANYLRDNSATTADYTGNLLLVRDIVIRYLRGGVMPYDAAHDAFTVTGLEEEVAYGFDFTAGGRPLRLKFAGIADRIDRLDDGSLRVVDYKTGTPHLEFAGLESLFHGEGKQRLSNILQTLLYSMMLYRTRGVDAVPTLYYVRSMNRDDYLPTLDDRGGGLSGAPYTHYAEEFERLVRETLAELFDPSVPFRQCADADTCQYCDFNAICKR